MELLITGVHDVTTAETTAAEATGATIIQFPVRKPADTIPADDPLTVSLANLNAALRQQRAAVTAWRSVIGELRTSTIGLHESLQRYSASLGTLGDSVSVLRGQARALEQWADNAIAVDC
jgi:hypothetical protein